MFEKQLIEAIIAGDKNKVVRLLQLGANIDPENEFDPIPLNVAASYNRHNIIPILIDQGGRINGRDASGNTPLHEAASKGHVETIRVLLAVSTNELAAQNPQGDRPLHLAASNNHSDAIMLLVQRGADLNSANGQGNTALHYAANFGALDAARALLALGANFFITNHAMETPLKLSERKNQQNIIKLLKKTIDDQRFAAYIFLSAEEVGLPQDVKLNIVSYLPIFESKDPSHRGQILKKVLKKIDPYCDAINSLSSYERMSSYQREDTPMYGDYESPMRGSPSRS